MADLSISSCMSVVAISAASMRFIAFSMERRGTSSGVRPRRCAVQVAERGGCAGHVLEVIRRPRRARSPAATYAGRLGKQLQASYLSSSSERALRAEPTVIRRVSELPCSRW
jgi:hypothetical protein